MGAVGGGDADGLDWVEPVQVGRSRELAKGHARTPEQNLIEAGAAAVRLTPPHPLAYAPYPGPM